MKLVKNIIDLSKVRLTMSVVFSAVAGYFIASKSFVLIDFSLLLAGGFLVVAASNGFNQIIERQYDKLMTRTSQRPLPSNRMSAKAAYIISLIMLCAGVYLLFKINLLCGFFGFLSVLLYVLIYTPMKRISSISVLVGAFPGAIPFLLGWIAVTNELNIEALILFSIQFIWQFPHFWAIAWVCDKDYQIAGFKMLPGKKEKSTAWKIVLYTFFLIPLSILPYFSISGSLSISIYSLILVLILGLWFFSKAYILLSDLSDNSAKKLMFASFIYLPLVQIIYVLDSFIF